MCSFNVFAMGLSLVFFALAAICNALMDVLQFHYYKFRFANKVNKQFWNPQLSWKNKYIDGSLKNGLRFKGIFGFMANFLDAWHLFKMMMIICFALSVLFFPISFKFCIFNHYFLNGLCWMALLGIAWNIPFNYFFNNFFVKK